MDLRNYQKTAIATLGFAFTIAATPLASFAQDRPSYAGHDEDTVKGRIVSITGQYDVSVRDDRGYVDHVRMHQGTIINPNGLSLSPGMTVTVLGVNEGSVLAANEIDTPYDYDQAPAYPAYSVGYDGGYGYGYPYGYGGYPFGYGYGYGYPGVAIGFSFGGYGYGRGGYYGGYHGYRGGYGGYHGYGGGYHGGYVGGYNRGSVARGGYSGSHGTYGGARGGSFGGGSRGSFSGARSGGGSFGGGHGGGGGHR